MEVAISDIVIGARRREDPGDITGLAKSIGRYGLLHPVVIDEGLTLVAGERRIRACQQLGWTEIEARSVGDLSDAERNEIELEENVRRKDLTEYERSRLMVKLAETAAETLRENVAPPTELLANSAKNPKGGRPSQPDAGQKVAERIGVPRKTIEDARQHVAAVEQHPVLADQPKVVAIDFAQTVRDFPELAPANSPELPPAEVVRLGKVLRNIPEGPERDKARDAAGRWHKVYGPSPEDRAKAQPAILASKAMERLHLAELIVEKAGGAAAIMEDLRQEPAEMASMQAGLWLDQLQRMIPVLVAWERELKAFGTRNLRRVQ